MAGAVMATEVYVCDWDYEFKCRLISEPESSPPDVVETESEFFDI